MFMTGLAVMTMPLWLPIYMVGVMATTAVYVVIPVVAITLIVATG